MESNFVFLLKLLQINCKSSSHNGGSHIDKEFFSLIENLIIQLHFLFWAICEGDKVRWLNNSWRRLRHVRGLDSYLRRLRHHNIVRGLPSWLLKLWHSNIWIIVHWLLIVHSRIHHWVLVSHIHIRHVRILLVYHGVCNVINDLTLVLFCRIFLQFLKLLLQLLSLDFAIAVITQRKADDQWNDRPGDSSSTT